MQKSNAIDFVKEGYQLNVIVYRAVTEVTRAVGSLEFELVRKRGAKEDVLTDHPILRLLERPNPTQGGDGFLKELFTNYLLTGEMAATAFPETGKPAELWSQSPLYLTVKAGRGGLPSAYVYKQNNVEKTFPVTYPSGECQMFFMKMFNPLDYWRGQAPLVAAGLAADTHNAGMRWNYSLLENSARPSMAVKLLAGAGAEVVSKLKEWFRGGFQGARNAGDVPVLPVGADLQMLSQTSRDMDFMNTQKEAAKLIASAFGVPLPLIDNDAATFNNIEQAKERFYTDTILPLMDEFLSQFSSWLSKRFGEEGLYLRVNADKIGALEGVRTRTYDRAIKAHVAGVLTLDETREALGYAPLGDAALPADVQKSISMLAYGTD
jgi:HK97 family phage portal protein